MTLFSLSCRSRPPGLGGQISTSFEVGHFMPTKDARDGVVDKELLGAFRSQNPKHVEERARYFKPVPGLANQRIQCKECAGGTKFFDGLGELFGHCKSIQDANKGGRRSSQHGAMAVYIAIDILKCRDATQSAVSRATLHCVRPASASASAQSSRQQQHPHNVVTFSHRLAWPPMVISTGFCYHEPDRTDMRAKAASAEDVFLLYQPRRIYRRGARGFQKFARRLSCSA